MILSLDPKFKLKKFKKLIVTKKQAQDTTSYSNPHMSCLFTNYIQKNNIFLPQKIIISTNTELGDKHTKNTFIIDYKKIIF